MTFRRSLKIAKRDMKDKSVSAKKSKTTDALDFIIEKTEVLYPTSTLEQAMKKFIQTRSRSLPIIDAGQKNMLGEISPRDIINYYGGGEKHKIFLKNNETMASAANAPVKMIMEKPTFCDENSPFEKALELLKKSNTVFVIKDKKLSGKIGIETIIHAIRGANINMKVKEAMTKKTVTATPGYTFKDACEVLVQNRFGELPIVQENEIVGIITYADLMKYASGPAIKKTYEETAETRIKEIMTEKTVTIKPNDDVEKAVGIMEKTGYRALPVVDKKLVGIITQRDIVKKIK